MKNLMVLLLILVTQTAGYSQLDPYKWRLGVSAGYTNYYGDLSPHPISSVKDYSNFFRLFNYNKNYLEDYSYAVSLERALNSTLGLQFSAGKYAIAMSDRYIDPSNVLQIETPNFERSLNFKTEILDYGIDLVFKSDNGRMLKKNAFMAPYLVFGMGWLNFKVFGDLYDENNNGYDYSNPRTITDGFYETRLDQLNTERAEGYSNHAFYGHLGLGLRFRIGKQLELFAQSDFKLTSTDYLDDVSGLYRPIYGSAEQLYAARPNSEWTSKTRGNNDGQNDWYINHSAGIKFSFAARKKAFYASRVSPGYYSATEILPETPSLPVEMADSLSVEDKKSEVTNNYITFIQLNQPYNKDSSYYSFKVLEADVSILNLEKQLEGNKGGVDSLNTVLDSLLSIRNSLPADIVADGVITLQTERIDNEINATQRQIEEASLKIGKVEDRLSDARQNKELFRSAYLLSVERQGQKDSLTFVNEILELPASVKQALAYQGAYYKIGQEPVSDPQMTASYQSMDPGPEIQERSIPNYRVPMDNNARALPDQNNQIYSELVQERARTNYLLEELQNYERTYESANPNYTKGEEKWENYARELNRSIDDNQRIADDQWARSQRGRSTSIVPVFIPGSNNNSQQEASTGQQLVTGGGMPVDIPQQLEAEPEVNRPLDSLLRSNYPEIPERTGLGVPAVNMARNRGSNAIDSLNNQAIGRPIDSKVEIFFGNNERSAEEQELNKLLPLVDFVKNNASFNLTISGFADNTGSLKYNLNLINDRIDRVREFLIEKSGISAERVEVSSGGLIVRGSGRNPSPSDRKVEVWIHENPVSGEAGKAPEQ